MSRNVYKNNKYILNPVDNFRIFAGFSCCAPDDDQDLDDFILNDAERHRQDLMAVTYGLFLIDYPNHPLAFATLQNDALKMDIDDYPYKSSPAVKIGRLGVSIKWQGGGIGTELLTMIKDFMLIDNRTGCKYITVDAYNNPRVLNFYQKNGFLILKTPNPQRRQESMYFDLVWHILPNLQDITNLDN